MQFGIFSWLELQVLHIIIYGKKMKELIKREIKNRISLILVFITLVLLFNCKSDKVEPVMPYFEPEKVVLELKVIDASNGEILNGFSASVNGIPNASDEHIIINEPETGSYKIVVRKDGYLTTVDEFYVDENGGVFRDIVMEPVQVHYSVDQGSDSLDAFLETDREFKVSYEENTFSSEQNFRFTPVEGVSSVSFSRLIFPLAEFEIAASEDEEFGKNISVTIPLPVRLEYPIDLRLLKYDFDIDDFVFYSDSVDLPDLNHAKVKVGENGRYILQTVDEVQITEDTTVVDTTRQELEVQENQPIYTDRHETGDEHLKITSTSDGLDSVYIKNIIAGWFNIPLNVACDSYIFSGEGSLKKETNTQVWHLRIIYLPMRVHIFGNTACPLIAIIYFKEIVRIIDLCTFFNIGGDNFLCIRIIMVKHYWHYIFETNCRAVTDAGGGK